MITIRKMMSALAVTSCGMFLALGSATEQTVVTQVDENIEKKLADERPVVSARAEAVSDSQESDDKTDQNKTEQDKSQVGGVASAGASAVSIVNVDETARQAREEAGEAEEPEDVQASAVDEAASANDGLTYSEFRKIVLAAEKEAEKSADDTKKDEKVSSGDADPAEDDAKDSADDTESQVTPAEGESGETTDDDASEKDGSTVDTKEEFGYEHLGIIDIDGYVNIRKDKNPESEIVGQLQPNFACDILDVETDWVHIKSGDIEGYIRTAYLLTGDEAVKMANKVVSRTATVTADILNVRAEGSMEGEIIGTVNNGDELEVDTEALKDAPEGWVSITLTDGNTGFVSAEYVEIKTSLPTAVSPDKAVDIYEQQLGTTGAYTGGTYTGAYTGGAYTGAAASTDIVAFATQFVGHPYVWGGESLTDGCDCSGFVMKIYERYGIELPHSSAEQSNYGMPVDPTQAQAGDLVFYDHGKGYVNHVGMCIGNGKIVHASNSRDGIIISDLFYSNPYCVKRLM